MNRVMCKKSICKKIKEAAGILQSYIGGLLCIYVLGDEDFSDLSNKVKLLSFEED